MSEAAPGRLRSRFSSSGDVTSRKRKQTIQLWLQMSNDTNLIVLPFPVRGINWLQPPLHVVSSLEPPYSGSTSNISCSTTALLMTPAGVETLLYWNSTEDHSRIPWTVSSRVHPCIPCENAGGFSLEVIQMFPPWVDSSIPSRVPSLVSPEISSEIFTFNILQDNQEVL